MKILILGRFVIEGTQYAGKLDDWFVFVTFLFIFSF